MKRIFALPKRLITFFKEVGQELKLVEFPSRSTTLNMTYIVLGGSVLLSVALLIIDSVFLFVRGFLTTFNS